jgi:hypothetical protein
MDKFEISQPEITHEQHFDESEDRRNATIIFRSPVSPAARWYGTVIPR